MPLTDVFLLKKKEISDDATQTTYPKQVSAATLISDQNASTIDESSSSEGKMSVKIFFNRLTKRVVYAKAKRDFADLVFSFLTFPVGSIIKFLGGGCSSMGCLSNLYQSVEDLSKDGHFKSEVHKAKLLSPKLPADYGCSNQLLKVEEDMSGTRMTKCSTCYAKFTVPWFHKCVHGLETVILHYMNPKRPFYTKILGGEDMLKLFMITDDLTIQPYSIFADIHLRKKLKVTSDHLEERVISVGTKEALTLLQASLFSKTALSWLASNTEENGFVSDGSMPSEATLLPIKTEDVVIID